LLQGGEHCAQIAIVFGQIPVAFEQLFRS